jgi:hypothetical protein
MQLSSPRVSNASFASSLIDFLLANDVNFVIRLEDEAEEEEAREKLAASGMLDVEEMEDVQKDE